MSEADRPEPPDAKSSSALEQIIADLWRRALRLERVGLDDNFFDLGGDSLQLLAVHSNLQKTLKAEIAIIDLFEFTTVQRLAKHLAGTKKIETAFPEIQTRADKQRAAFAKLREHRTGNS